MKYLTVSVLNKTFIVEGVESDETNALLMIFNYFKNNLSDIYSKFNDFNYFHVNILPRCAKLKDVRIINDKLTGTIYGESVSLPLSEEVIHLNVSDFNLRFSPSYKTNIDGSVEPIMFKDNDGEYIKLGDVL